MHCTARAPSEVEPSAIIEQISALDTLPTRARSSRFTASEILSAVMTPLAAQLAAAVPALGALLSSGGKFCRHRRAAGRSAGRLAVGSGRRAGAFRRPFRRRPDRRASFAYSAAGSGARGHARHAQRRSEIADRQLAPLYVSGAGQAADALVTHRPPGWEEQLGRIDYPLGIIAGDRPLMPARWPMAAAPARSASPPPRRGRKRASSCRSAIRCCPGTAPPATRRCIS